VSEVAINGEKLCIEVKNKLMIYKERERERRLYFRDIFSLEP
jgi:hypothetical protein